MNIITKSIIAPMTLLPTPARFETLLSSDDSSEPAKFAPLFTSVVFSEPVRFAPLLDSTVFVDYAYQGNGYIGFDLKTGETVDNPGPTTIKLYEIAKNNELSLQDLQNHFRQNWQRLQIEIGERVKYFYDKNPQVA